MAQLRHTDGPPKKQTRLLADSVHLELMKFLNRGQCRHQTVVISEVGYRVKSSVNDTLLREKSRAARRVDSRRRMKTRRLLAQMAWIMEIIMREDLSDLPEELCACCSWTILTPQKCWFTSRTPSPAPPPPVQILLPHNLHLWYSRGLVLSTGPDEMGFRRPRAQRVKINSPDV